VEIDEEAKRLEGVAKAEVEEQHAKPVPEVSSASFHEQQHYALAPQKDGCLFERLALRILGRPP
jgi:hypothetical protein